MYIYIHTIIYIYTQYIFRNRSCAFWKWAFLESYLDLKNNMKFHNLEIEVLQLKLSYRIPPEWFVKIYSMATEYYRML